MDTGQTVLLVDVGDQPMQELAIRVRRVGFRAVRAKTPDDAREALRDHRYAIGAVVIPPDLAAHDLGLALDAFRDLVPDRDLPILVSGPHPGDAECERLRDSGVHLALWTPVDDHGLRFQINRALGPKRDTGNERRAERVPADWPIRIRTGQRDKPARVYSLSAQGAFLATARPSYRNSLVYLTLPLPDGPIELAARVVMTNVPGNLIRKNLPLGMGVCFAGLSAETEEAILTFTGEHGQDLLV